MKTCKYRSPRKESWRRKIKVRWQMRNSRVWMWGAIVQCEIITKNNFYPSLKKVIFKKEKTELKKKQKGRRLNPWHIERKTRKHVRTMKNLWWQFSNLTMSIYYRNIWNRWMWQCRGLFWLIWRPFAQMVFSMISRYHSNKRSTEFRTRINLNEPS